MVSTVDNKNGLVKTYWQDVRKRILKVAPQFAKLVDVLAPDRKFPIYLAYLPYGALKGDTISTFIPTQNGRFYRLSDPDAPRDVQKNLGYGKHSSPFGLVLEKKLEYFVDSKELGLTIPWGLASPGTFFPLKRMAHTGSKRICAPNGLLSASSGIRSTFMLPNIGCQVNHANLQRDFNIQSLPPKTLYEHWHVFKEILNSPVVNSDWRSCLVYFSENWVTQIKHNKAWLPIKNFLYEQAWHLVEYERNRIYYEIAYSIIQNKRNLKPNPYLVDTARHLFAIALGAAPGYAPAINEEALPVDTLREIFINSYGLKKYYPTIMEIDHFSYEAPKGLVYYSLQNPSTFVSSPKSRKISSTLVEMRELKHIMRIFTEELSHEDDPCFGTILSEVAEKIDFNYFHNKIDCHNAVKCSAEIPTLDPRMTNMHKKYKPRVAKFSSDAPFLRGCISLQKKK